MHPQGAPCGCINATGAAFLVQGQQTQHPAFQHVVNPNRAGANRHPMRGAPKPNAYQRPVYDPGYRNVNKRKATRRGDELVGYTRKQGQPLHPLQCKQSGSGHAQCPDCS